MSLVLLAGPATEPVDLAVTKTHLRVDGTAEDTYITGLIETSRLQIEAALGLALIEQRWRWTLDRWPARFVEMPIRPVISVQSVVVTRADGAPVAVPASAYHVDGNACPPRIVAEWESLPEPGIIADGIAVEFTAGFGAAATDVPAPIRHAILLLTAHWFECREPSLTMDRPAAIPDAVSALLAPYRVVRL
jgi:uncharacterized phiE125 gp8 family phage protein